MNYPERKPSSSKKAKSKEIKGLQDKWTLRVILKKEVPGNAIIQSSQLELTIEDAHTSYLTLKGRVIAQDHL